MDAHGPETQKLWKAMKDEILQLAREYKRTRVSKIDALLNKYEAKRKEILARLAAASNDDDKAMLDETEEEIRDLKSTKVLQKRVNLTAKYHAVGESGTKFDYALHREKAPRDTIHKLRIPGSNPPTYEKTSRGMAKIATEHHNGLQTEFTDKPTDSEWDTQTRHSLGKLKPSLENEEKAELRKPITPEEVSSAIWGIKNGKASGLDGIPIEIWKCVLRRRPEDKPKEDSTGTEGHTPIPEVKLAEMLTKVLNSVMSDGVAEDTGFSEGWLCPIYKKKDKSDIGNYRPITVLNNDYKIYTKILTERLSKVAPKLIHKDQAGFIRGRTIFNQTELIRTVIHTAETEERRGAIVCLDQEKAYDKIRHDFLWRTLETFGFPVEFIDAIKHIYETAETRVILNGVLGDFFKITRGVRQGDPLSCLLFDLAIESLAEALRSSDLKGMNFEGSSERVLSNLFADDTTVFLDCTDDVATLFEILQAWCRVSGARFNVDKTIFIPLGDHTYREQVRTTRRLHPTQGSSIPEGTHIAGHGEPVRILGAFYGYGFDENDIWAPILAKAKLTLAKWARDRPTIRGLVLGNNTMIGGYTQYLTRVQGMPRDVLKKFNAITDDLVHAKHGEKKTNAIGMATLQEEKDNGGMQVLDLDCRNEAIGAVTARELASNPDWAKISRRSLARAAPRKYRDMGIEFLIDPLLQSWPVNTNSRLIPTTQRVMMKVVYKYGVKIMPIGLTNEIRLNMPYLLHAGAKDKLVSKWNDKYGKCHRVSHGILTIRDLIQHINKSRNASCTENEECECSMCVDDRLSGCEHPWNCRLNATKKLDNLSPEWDPRLHSDLEPQDDSEAPALPALSNEYKRAYVPGKEESSDPLQLIRIFTKIPQPQSSTQPDARGDRYQRRQAAREHPIQRGGEDIEVYTDGSCHNNGTDQAICGSGIWYAENDSRNAALSIGLSEKSNNVGELAAILVAIQRHKNDARLRIVTDSQYAIDLLTKQAEKLLDGGFTGVKNRELVQAIFAEVINSRAPIYLKKVKGHSGDPGNEAADALANMGAHKLQHDTLDLSSGSYLDSLGAKLTTISQAEAYRAIREFKPRKPRPKTERMVEKIQDTLEGQTGTLHPTSAVWRSLRQRRGATLSLKFSAFAWRAVHNSIKVGEYWRGKGRCEDRMACTHCNVDTESLHHILFECKMTGQETVWELAQNAWNETGLEWPHLSVELILGIGLVQARSKDGVHLKGRTRLLQILISESAYLIWLLRCEWRIGREQNTLNLHTRAEITSRWKHVLNRRLRMDWALTNKLAYGRQTLNPDLVANTWRGVASNKESIRTDVVGAEVLVGRTQVRRPPGRNR